MASYLTNSARTLIFSTGPAPPSRRSAEALDRVDEQPRRIERLRATPKRFVTRSANRGSRSHPARATIVPLVVGDAARAVAVCERALQRGVFAQAIRPPTVPEGSSRLRLAAMSSHNAGELAWAAAQIGAAVGEAGATQARAGTALGDPVRPRACGITPHLLSPGCSSPARTPGSGKRSSRARLPPRCAARGRRVSVFKPG